ncbi:CamS family sex pheromone protein [Levilactobacillus bambusae]|uniref:CamS family sex pheromone protein n=1 Tax=Levilactobacillus bambusae TaxID=2024736 RepID=A0A2V1N002_9LACO|nr:CamS family sex pheromone protein [Levilactobacillus bambusae]
MKRLRTIMALAVSVLFLAACGNLSNSTSSSGGATTSKSGTTLTGQTSNGDYEGVIKNGHYLTSKSRGVTNTEDSGNVYNVKSFESGMQNLSKKIYPPQSYVFQEGQYLDSSTVEDWLGRESSSNPTGLNPKKNKSTSPTSRNPIYIQALEEQDYMKQSGKSLKLSGMTIGIAVNSVDYYKKTQYGATYQTNISQAKGEAYAKDAAKTVLKRLRAKKALKDVPITIALYRQSSNDSLVGGTFFAYTQSKGNQTTINNWSTVNQKNYVLPVENGESGPKSADKTAFSNFKSQVTSFFPNLSGVTAQVHYENGSLTGMHVNVTTQFYSQTEITSFTQYLAQAAQKYLPAKVPADITVTSATGETQSYLSRSENGSKFQAHVFDSY